MTRAKIVLRSAVGSENRQVAGELGVDRATVKTWRDRFVATRLPGIEQDRGGRGRKPTKRRR